MKKIISILLVAVLAFSFCATCAAAEETRSVEDMTSYEVSVVTIDSAYEEMYEGCWISFEGGYDLFLPEEWYIYDLSEDQINEGFTSMYGDDTHYLLTKIISPAALDEMEVTDYDSLIATLEDLYTDIHVYEINDMPYPIVCCWSDSDFMTLFAGGNGELHNIILVNADDEEFLPYINNIICTLSLSAE